MQTINPTAGNGTGKAVDHVYTGSGTYTVQVTATDQGGLVSPTVSQTITITAMALQDDPLAPGQKTSVQEGMEFRARKTNRS